MHDSVFHGSSTETCQKSSLHIELSTLAGNSVEPLPILPVVGKAIVQKATPSPNLPFLWD